MRPILATTVLVVLLFAGAVHLPSDVISGFGEEVLLSCSPSQRARNERSAGTHLKTLAGAQAWFRMNDLDGDGVNQFWRDDLAGLHFRVDRRGSKLNLIAADLAIADERPLGRLPSRQPLNGYWFRAIRHADEDPRSLDPQRFAYVAYPASPSSGKYMFIIDENNSIRRRAVGSPDGIDIFPTDEELKQFWSRA